MSADHLTLPREVIFILLKLQEAGYQSYLVGGAVRDLLRQTWSQNEQLNDDHSASIISPYDFDYDFTTNARPEEIIKVFPKSFYENQFGTVSLTLEHLWEMMTVSDQYQTAFQAVLKSNQQKKSKKIIDLMDAKKIHVSLQDVSLQDVSSQHHSLLEGTQSENQATAEQQTAKKLLPNFEITTFRSDEVYENGPRRPSAMNWGNSIA